MDVWTKCYAPLIGRIFMGGFFLWAGITAALNLPAAADIFTAHGIAHGIYWAALAIGVEVLGGIAIVVGLFTAPAALILALYLIVRSFTLTNFGNDTELSVFLYDLGLIGGLLYISAYGAGAWAAAPLKRSR